MARAAESLGVGTEIDLRDYYRIKPAAAKQAIAELVEDGRLEPVQVRGWKQLAYTHPEARVPRKGTGPALLCPFDPLIWERARTGRMFDFLYRIETHAPAPKRVYGYHVVPFPLHGRPVRRGALDG